MARNPAKLLERLDVKKGLVSEAERAVLGTPPSSMAAGRRMMPSLAEMPAPPPLLEEARGRGRPPGTRSRWQTTIRLTRGEWAALQAQVTRRPWTAASAATSPTSSATRSPSISPATAERGRGGSSVAEPCPHGGGLLGDRRLLLGREAGA